ncbi:hypothetical protein ACFODO_19340 [Acinetobacter sichuanensis]|uniref:Uncharacterized protein n=1 Tax=Acinetobacter sichuanensis TaxID=2136183 RepID=A0ABV7BID5_9GAMM|nr:hypothetical protein [Acinetobacter sichuanensis]
MNNEFKIGDLVRVDTLPDAPLREVLGVRDSFIFIDFGGWKGWVQAAAYELILSSKV